MGEIFFRGNILPFHPLAIQKLGLNKCGQQEIASKYGDSVANGINVLLFLQEKSCTQGWKSACKVVEGSSGLKPSGRAKRIGEALVNGCGQLHKGVTIDWPCVMNSFSGTRFCAGFDLSRSQ